MKLLTTTFLIISKKKYIPQSIINLGKNLILFSFLFHINILSAQIGLETTNWRAIPGRDFGAAKWHEIMDDPDVTFEEVQKAFYKEWEGKEYEKGKGYKQFNRWAIYMEGKANQFVAMKKGEKKFQNFPNSISAQSATAANWTAVGPLTPPNPPANYSGWNNEGIGRIDVVAFDPINSNILYIGSPNGGLWKSVNTGSNWMLLSDNSWPNHSISDICVNPNDGQNIFVATGIRDGGSGHLAQGIMKTTDGGTSWSHIALPFFDSRYYRLIIDPNTASGSSLTNKLLLATRYGIYYSTDSGATWTASTLPANFSRRRIYDMEYKPGSSTIVYAATDGILYQSNDGGVTFTEMIGIPFTDEAAERIAIAVTPAEANAVYFLVSNNNDGFLGIYKYDESSFSTVADGSESLSYVDGTPYSNNLGVLWGQSWYDWSFAIDPHNANDMIAASVAAFRSKDGGNTWQYISSSVYGGGSIHVDMHAAEYHPITSVPIIGCDGGTYQWLSDDSPWNRLNNLNISEMYTLAVSETSPNNMITGLQDNGAFYNDAGIWNGARIGDILSVAIDPVEPNILYSSGNSSDMAIRKSLDKGARWKVILKESDIGENVSSTFSQPEIKIHPYLRHVIYTAFTNVHKSTDGGETWTNISDNSLDTYFKEHLEIAPSNPDYIYTSTTHTLGGLYRTTNGGITWDSLSWPVEQTLIIDITIDDKNPNHIYAVMTNGTVHESINGGVDWTNISTGLASVYPRSLEYLHGSINELYLATDQGVFYKNGTTDWQLFNTNLPFANSFDLALTPKDNKIKVATYGRGVWESTLQNPSSLCYAPTPSIIKPATGCTATNILLNASPAPTGYSYQWYNGEQPISGATAAEYTATTSGNYSVIYMGACRSFSSAIETIQLDANQSIIGYTESFESGLNYTNLEGDSLDWSLKSGSTNTTNTGPTAASEGNYYMYIESSSPYNPSKTGVLETDCFSVNGANPVLVFDYSMYGANMGSLEVHISTDEITWLSIFSKAGDQGDQWHTAQLDMSNYSDTIIKLRFKGTTGDFFRSDIAIDNIRFTTFCPTAYSTANGNMLTGIQATNASFETSGILQSNQILQSPTEVTYDAGDFIQLLPGFEVQSGTLFHAFIEGCQNSFQEKPNEKTIILPVEITQQELDKKMVIYPNPTQQSIQISFTLDKSQHISIYLMDFSGKIVDGISNKNLPKGAHIETINFQHTLASGFYQVVLKTESAILVEKVIYQK